MNPLARALCLAIRAYQLILRPVIGANCRFAPSCSAYAHEAICTHGVIHGTQLASRRILRCHPWNPGGFDPVPTIKER
ncbi:MAG: membrane protein insertion efficiency factor YidD [Acidocella sp.]|nr:membrane protein insertion efficiency factor YidD [Acidocella sp.]